MQPCRTVVLAYLDAGSYVIAKKIDTRLLPDTVKCRHILIGTVDPQSGQRRRDDSTASKKADSIFTALKSGSDFGVLATALSDDEGSKNNKGEYTFSSTDINLAKEFYNFIFNKPVGANCKDRTATILRFSEQL
jgi:peptidyl-prolyl cis-trans isomerase D